MPTSWKTIRVFISSTFRDMHAERDHLVRFVFPKLRQELLKWHVHLEDVDLRWGVTTDQDAFDLCMTEIENCHPRFICMLGGRYGWVPPPKEIESIVLASVLSGSTKAGDLASVEREALHALYAPAEDGGVHRLKEKPRAQAELEAFKAQSKIAVLVLQRAGLEAARLSITASEIHYGALDRLQIPAFRYFYFRKDSVTDAIPEPFARDCREPAESPAEQLLKEIKAQIKDPGTRGRVLAASGREEERPLTCHEYPCEWDVASGRIVGLNEFGDLVYDDLLASVIAQFGDVPEQKEALTDEDEFAEEADQMDAFIEERTDHFILGSRDPLMRDLLAFATADGTPNTFILTGEPGSGKSAFLAKFTRELASSSALPHSNSPSLLIPHFIGASTGSTDLRRTLRRLCHELALAADNTEPLPLDIKELITHFQKLLAEAASKQRVILVFDALNQLDPTDGAHWLNWLPGELPPGVRVFASVIAPTHGEKEHQTLANLKNRPGGRIEELKQLAEADTLAIIEGYLKRYSKRLSEEQIVALKEKPAGHLPLYVLTALEELRTLGTYEEITARIRTLPGDARTLFGWILTERLARDPGFRDREGRPCGAALVGKFAACLGVSRHGLSPAELTALLDPGDPLGNVAALLRLLRPYLMRRGELLDFYHGQFREAAEAAHLDAPEKLRAAHHSVATCLHAFADPHRDGQCRDATPHALGELPHHQTRAEAWPDLIATLENIFFLEAKVIHGMAFDLVEDFTAAADSLPAEHGERQRLRLLNEAVRRDIHFITRHAKDYPQALFQCLWNSAWWYDCAEAEHRYVVRQGDVKETSSWGSRNTAPRLSPLLERWRIERAAAYSGFPWLRALRPPFAHLGAGQSSVLRGHAEAVMSVAFSPDGLRVLSASNDKTLRLWDADCGGEMIVLRAHESEVRSATFSPDGRRVLSGSSDKTLRLWDVVSGCEIAVLRGHDGAVMSVAFSPDGCRVLSGSSDKTLWLWDVVSGLRMIVFCGHQRGVTSVAFSPDGSLVASGSLDHTVRLWDAVSGRELTVLRGHEHAVWSVAFSPNGGYVLSGSHDRTARLWDSDTGRELSIMSGHKKAVKGVAFSFDGHRVLTGSSDHTVRLWEVDSGRELLLMRGHESRVTSVAFSHDGRRMLSGSVDRTVRLWDSESGSELRTLRGHKKEVKSVTFSPDGCKVLTSSSNQNLRLWDVASGCELAVLRGHRGRLINVTFSPDGHHVLTGSSMHELRLWDAKGGRALAVMRDHQNSVTSVAFSHSGDRVVSRDESGKALVWDLEGRCLLQTPDDSQAVANQLSAPASWQHFVQNGEMGIRVSRDAEFLTWFPDSLSHLQRHPDGRTWAGGVGSNLVLLQLEDG